MENWFSKTFQDYWLLYRRVSSSSSTSIPCRLPWHHRLFLFLLFLLRIRELVFRFVHIYTVQHTALQISLLMYSSSSAHFPSVSFFPTGMIGLYVSFAFGGGNSSSSRCFSACHHSSSCAAVFLGTLVVRYSIPYRPLYIPINCRKRKEEQLVHCELVFYPINILKVNWLRHSTSPRHLWQAFDESPEDEYKVYPSSLKPFTSVTNSVPLTLTFGKYRVVTRRTVCCDFVSITFCLLSEIWLRLD